ncbi:MAG: PAS domain-containing protein [Planctomycetes bacterium]|nr:PAS domain-containing protein [Planctomycetota bacterium]
MRLDFPIVGIGASAGGLEAFRALLGHLPSHPGFACVLIQHLDPTHGSLLSEILANSSRPPVVEARDGVRVRPDRVYVIPPGAAMTISKGVLKIQPRRRGPHMPIDHFLTSLARDRGDRAVGVILSGTATDGTHGLQAIKAAGGMTFAQEEATAKFPGMPHAAAGSGCVDFILPPARIAEELERIARISGPLWGCSLEQTDAEEAGPADGSLEPILAILHKRTGVDFRGYKLPTIRRRTARRMAVHRLTEGKDYLAILEKDRGEADALYEDLLINVTSFFREPDSFEFLRRRVVPALLKRRKGNEPLRIWVPGCATGEEMYSVAICFVEALGEEGAAGRIQIFGTDLSERAIVRARSGIYPATIANDVSAARLRSFFTTVDGSFQISKSIRDLCVLARHDITRDPPFSRLDLISCRNLLIYLAPPLQKRVIPMFHYALKPSGFLILGSSESIGAGTHLFSTLDKHCRVYVRKEAAVTVPARHEPRVRVEIQAPESPKPPIGRSPDLVLQDVDRVILARFSPPAVLVDADFEILQFRGQVAPFVAPAPGKATLSLLKMCHESIAQDVRLALHESKKTRESVRSGRVHFRHGDHVTDIEIEVVPIAQGIGAETAYLVLFERPAPAAAGGKRAPRNARSLEKLVAKLQQELAATRESLQLTVEEHDAANEEYKSAHEEILSSNEELQSTNEELETAKEELQSANEELTTLNEELQVRNQELTQVNDDITNVLSSVNVPILLLAGDLRIRRFTPVVDRIFNVVPTDVGRSILDIRPKIELPDLDHMLTDAIERVATVEREIRDHGGRWYQMTVRPYRTRGNRIDGVVMVFFDIDTMKKSLAEVQLARDYAETMAETVRQPILFLDSSLRIRNANRSLAQFLGTTVPALIGRLVFDLFPTEIPALRDALLRTLTQGASFDGLRLDVDMGPAGVKTLTFYASAIQVGVSTSPLILLSFENETGRR